MKGQPYIVQFSDVPEYENTGGKNQLCRDILPKDTIGSIAVGFNAMQSNACNGPGTHEEWHQVFVFTKGSGELILDGKRYPIQAPSIAAIPAGTEHDVVTGPDEELDYVYLNNYLSSE